MILYSNKIHTYKTIQTQFLVFPYQVDKWLHTSKEEKPTNFSLEREELTREDMEGDFHIATSKNSQLKQRNTNKKFHFVFLQFLAINMFETKLVPYLRHSPLRKK